MTYIGNKVLAPKSWLDSLTGKEKAFAMVNYGPWDRLNDNKPILTAKAKYAGANFTRRT